MNVHLLKIVTLTFTILFSTAHLIAMPVATAPAQPAPAVPVAAVPVVPVAAVPIAPVASAPAHQEQLKAVAAALHDLEQAKQELTKLLTELDAKLLEARTQAAQATSLRFDLLNKQNEVEAKADFAKIHAANETVKATQQYVQSDFTPNFNKKLTELQVKATQADTTLKVMNTKPVTVPIAAMPPAPTMPAAPVASIPMPIAGQPIQPAQPVTAPAPHGFMNSITSGIASTITSIKGLFGFKHADDTAKKKTVMTLPPEAIPADPAQRAQAATVMVQQMTQQMQTLDATRNTIQQSIASLNQTSQYLETAAKQTPEGTKLFAESKKSHVEKKDPQWKQVTLSVTGKILDGASAVVSNLYGLFDATVGSFFRTFVKDVEKKVASSDVKH